MVKEAPSRLELDEEVEVAFRGFLAPDHRSEDSDRAGTVSGCYREDLVPSFGQFGMQTHLAPILWSKEYKGSPGGGNALIPGNETHILVLGLLLSEGLV